MPKKTQDRPQKEAKKTPKKVPKKTVTVSTPSETVSSLPIVGIGASAGGLEAFEQFFTHMPPDTGMAFVLIQHLDPTHKSILTELVRRYTRMRVVEVEDGMMVEPQILSLSFPRTDIWLF